MAPAAEIPIQRPKAIAALPGGGVLLMGAKDNRIIQVGPAKADHQLASQPGLKEGFTACQEEQKTASAHPAAPTKRPVQGP